MMQSQSLTMLRNKMAVNLPSLIEGVYQEAAVLMAITVNAELGEGFDETVSAGGEQWEPALILTQRAAHLHLHPGEAAFPGGKKDPEDKNLLATALREANEEIGLLAADVEVLGALNQRLTRTDIKVSPFVGLVPANVQLMANLDELDCIYTIPLSFCRQQKNVQVAEKEYKGSIRKVPHFEYQGHSVWGVTALMIMDLMNTVFDAGLRIEP